MSGRRQSNGGSAGDGWWPGGCFRHCWRRSCRHFPTDLVMKCKLVHPQSGRSLVSRRVLSALLAAEFDSRGGNDAGRAPASRPRSWLCVWDGVSGEAPPCRAPAHLAPLLARLEVWDMAISSSFEHAQPHRHTGQSSVAPFTAAPGAAAGAARRMGRGIKQFNQTRPATSTYWIEFSCAERRRTWRRCWPGTSILPCPCCLTMAHLKPWPGSTRAARPGDLAAAPLQQLGFLS